MAEENIKDFKEFLQNVYASIKEVDLEYLEVQKKELDKHRPFPERVLKSLEEKLEIDEVHNSTAIEGNTLSLGETALVLTKGITIGGKSLKDHLEVKSYDKGFKYIKSIYNQISEISEDIILELHKFVFIEFTEELKTQINHGIGFYRREPVFIKGSSFVPPNYLKIPDLMKFLVEFLNSFQLRNVDYPRKSASLSAYFRGTSKRIYADINAEKRGKHNFVIQGNSIKDEAIKKAILAHLGIATIHPFVDGNGRVARLLMNLILLKEGWPIIIVKKEKRADYLNSLEAIQKNPRDKKFLNLMLSFLQESFSLYKEIY